MEAVQSIFSRRSVREFKQKQVPDEIISLLASSALVCPKPGGLDIIDIIAIRHPDLKEKLYELSDKQDLFLQASVVLAIVTDVKLCERDFFDKGRDYAIQTAALAAENVMVAATALGLGSVYVAHFDQDAVHALLKIPSGKEIVALVALGWPEHELKPRPLPNLIGKLWFDTFGNRLKDPEKFESNYRAYLYKFFKDKKLRLMNWWSKFRKKQSKDSESKEKEFLP